MTCTHQLEINSIACVVVTTEWSSFGDEAFGQTYILFVHALSDRA